jgi:hypothetical protein
MRNGRKTRRRRTVERGGAEADVGAAGRRQRLSQPSAQRVVLEPQLPISPKECDYRTRGQRGMHERASLVRRSPTHSCVALRAAAACATRCR